MATKIGMVQPYGPRILRQCSFLRIALLQPETCPDWLSTIDAGSSISMATCHNEAMHIRFQSPIPNSRDLHTGIFGLANSLAKKGALTEIEHTDWRAGNDWFNAAYPDPSRTDPSVYDVQVNPLATAWFKSSAQHLLGRIPRYLEILDAHGISCARVESIDPGRVIYEDEVQIVVVPHPRHSI